MARPALVGTEKTQQVLIMIPSSLLAQIDLLLYDPFRGRARYGERSKLIATLLREWVASQTNKQQGDPKHAPRQ